MPFVGDSAGDLEAARAAGARPVLVLTGNGRRTLAKGAAEGCEVHEDLMAFAKALVAGTAPNAATVI